MHTAKQSVGNLVGILNNRTCALRYHLINELIIQKTKDGITGKGKDGLLCTIKNIVFSHE